MRKRGLLIGCENYEIDSISNVTSATNDLNLVDSSLAAIRFKNEILKDAKVSDITDKINDFINTCTPDSINLIYFSGHGYQSNGENYIIGTDFEFNKHKEYNLKDIFINQKEDSILIVIIDACRDEKFRHFGNYTETLSPGFNGYLIYSTLFNDVSFYQEEGYSHFTYNWCKILTKENMEIDTIFREVKFEMFSKNLKQSPIVINNLLNESIIINRKINLEEIDNEIYQYVEEFHSDPGSPCREPDYHGFVNAIEYFDSKMDLLEIEYRYQKVAYKSIPDNFLSESEHKYNTFINIKQRKDLFSNKKGVWYYDGVEVFIDEPIEAPSSFRRLSPENGKEINVEIYYYENESVKKVITTLPPGFRVHLKTNKEDKFITINDDILLSYSPSYIEITSPTVNVMGDYIKKIVGLKGRNLIGEWVKFDEIWGNQLDFYYKRS